MEERQYVSTLTIFNLFSIQKWKIQRQTDREWWKNLSTLWYFISLICFPKGRIKFRCRNHDRLNCNQNGINAAKDYSTALRTRLRRGGKRFVSNQTTSHTCVLRRACETGPITDRASERGTTDAGWYECRLIRTSFSTNWFFLFRPKLLFVRLYFSSVSTLLVSTNVG